MDIIEQSLVLAVLIGLSAFFSGVETAFVSLSDIRIQHLVERKKRGMGQVKALRDNNERLLITILIGNNLVNIAASSFATSIAISVLESNALGVVVGIMTLIILIFGEIIPKNIAMKKNEWIAVHSAPAIRLLQMVLWPLIKSLEGINALVSRPFRGDDGEPLITEAEIKSVVSLGEELGEVEEDERIMIHNIFRFSDMEACEIMVDRTRIFALESEETLETATPKIVQGGYSRIPVYAGHIDEIMGILYAKDVLQAVASDKKDVKARELARPAMFIPETMLIDDLLREFQKAKVHIALVVDEHGGISGLVTIEDLLEEIVGDIYDETDKEETLIRKLDKNRAVVKGETEIENVNRALHMYLDEKDDFETISGFILSRLRRIPNVGEQFKFKDCTFKVTKADQQRIIEVEITRQMPETPQESCPEPPE